MNLKKISSIIVTALLCFVLAFQVLASESDILSYDDHKNLAGQVLENILENKSIRNIEQIDIVREYQNLFQKDTEKFTEYTSNLDINDPSIKPVNVINDIEIDGKKSTINVYPDGSFEILSVQSFKNEDFHSEPSNTFLNSDDISLYAREQIGDTENLSGYGGWTTIADRWGFGITPTYRLYLRTEYNVQSSRISITSVDEYYTQTWIPTDLDEFIGSTPNNNSTFVRSRGQYRLQDLGPWGPVRTWSRYLETDITKGSGDNFTVESFFY